MRYGDDNSQDSFNSEEMVVTAQQPNELSEFNPTKAENLYNLTDQIEASVWDNIKLTHINAKLLEFAKNQALELEVARAQQPSSQASFDDLQHEVEGLRKKVSHIIFSHNCNFLFVCLECRVDSFSEQ